MEIVSQPVKVIPANNDQKELFELPSNEKTDLSVAIEKPKLTTEQEKSIPDVIDNITLTSKDKQDLLFNAFSPEQSEAHYLVDDNGFIVRHFADQETNKDRRFVNFEDVTFDMKKSQLNEQNFEYLKNSLKYLGFGENLNAALEARLKEGSEKFTLGATAVFDAPGANDTIHYELRFSKSTSTDKYFLNNYQATLELNAADGKVQEPVSQVFSLNKGNDITAKEAYNLLAGRAILKKAELSDRLVIVADNQEAAKVLNIAEAKTKISELASNKVAESYTLLAKNNTVVKTFDKTGKEVPYKGERQNLQLIHAFIQKNDKGNDDIPYNVTDMAGARQMIKDLTKDKNTAHITLLENGVPFARYDGKGKEIDIEPTKRKEDVWFKLDFEKKGEHGNYAFKTFFQGYGFDLDKALSNHPIKELNDPERKERLLASLRRGNLQSVTLDNQGTEVKGYVAANPQFKNLSLYDKDLKPVFEKAQEKKVQDQESKGYQRGR